MKVSFVPSSTIDPSGSSPAIEKSAEVVAFPTETVWGLGAPVTQAGWQALIRAKGRDPKQAFQVSCSTPELALEWARETELLHPLTTFWPGSLTLVAAAQDHLPAYLAPGGWIGLRVPSHPVARAVLEEYGGRLLTSSLNLSGQPTARTEAEARALGLAQRVFGDDGKAPSGAASTVLKVTEDKCILLRAGSISVQDLKAALRDTHLEGHTWEESDH